MPKFDLYFLYIALSMVVLLVILINLYWGTYFIILAQPLFISVLSEGAMSGMTTTVGVSKVIYGVLFALWFMAWGLSRGFSRKGKQPALAPSMAAPALALGGYLGVAILLGLVYGANFGDIIRDLSQYVGYLAVLPLLDLVRTPRQAKNLIFFLALVGLPTYLLTTIWGIGVKQRLDLSPALVMFQFAGQYWGPIEGAIWAVAVSFPGLAGQISAWLWLVLEGGMSIISGYRHKLLMFILAALTAFMVSGTLARRRLARYLIPVILSLMIVAIMADLSGMINLPLTDVTRDRYSTLLSGKKFQQDDSMQGRFQEAQWLLKKFWQNPVTGIGLGHGAGDPTLPGGYNFVYHNGYHASLMKFGVIGSLIFAWYFLALLRQALAIGRRADNYFARVIGLGLVVWLIPALIGSFWVNFFSNRGFALTVGVMAGLLPALVLSPQEAAADTRQAAAKVVTPALAIRK